MRKNVSTQMPTRADTRRHIHRRGWAKKGTFVQASALPETQPALEQKELDRGFGALGLESGDIA